MLWLCSRLFECFACRIKPNNSDDEYTEYIEVPRNNIIFR